MQAAIRVKIHAAGSAEVGEGRVAAMNAVVAAADGIRAGKADLDVVIHAVQGDPEPERPDKWILGVLVGPVAQDVVIPADREDRLRIRWVDAISAPMRLADLPEERLGLQCRQGFLHHSGFRNRMRA